MLVSLAALQVPGGAVAPFEMRQLAEGVYAAIPRDPLPDLVDGNAVFIVGSDGVLVVDANVSPSAARARIAALRRITGLPVKYVVNTHWHDDHTLGNQAYLEEYPGVRFIAHDSTRADQLTQGARLLAGYRQALPAALAELDRRLAALRDPRSRDAAQSERDRLAGLVAEVERLRLVAADLTVSRDLTVHLGDRDVRIRYLGRGNTKGDLIVQVPDVGVVATGDLLAAPIPFATDSYLSEWISTLDSLRSVPAEVIVPGHGPVVGSWDYLGRVQALLHLVLDRAAAARTQGLPLERAQDDITLEPLRSSFVRDNPVWSRIFDVYFRRPAVASAYRELAASPGSREAGWSRDIDSLLARLRREHYVYRSQPLPQALVDSGAALKVRISKTSDEVMLLELERLASYVGDGHTYVLPVAARRVESQWLPLEFYLFPEGLYVVGADSANGDLVGKRVLRMGDESVDRLLGQLPGLVHHDNAQTVRWFAPTFLRLRALHVRNGLSSDATSLRLGFDGRTVSVSFVPATSTGAVPKLPPSGLAGAPPPPWYLSAVRQPYWVRDVPEWGVVYLQFNQVRDLPGQPLERFSAALEERLRSSKPALLIVDVRHNNGGNKDILPPLVDVIARFAHVPGAKVVVITGRGTFSAAQVFVSLLAREPAILFAGEPSSSRPNFVGEQNTSVLDWSGALVSISNRYHESIPGDHREWIEPTIPLPLSAADYFANRDPVVEWLLNRFGRPGGRRSSRAGGRRNPTSRGPYRVPLLRQRSSRLQSSTTLTTGRSATTVRMQAPPVRRNRAAER